MPIYREKIYLVLVKPEATSGVDAVPDPLVNAVRTVGIPTLEVDYLDQGERGDVQTGLLSGADDAAAAGRFGRIEITVEAIGAGGAYSNTVRPPSDALNRIAGLIPIITTTAGSESIIYRTLDDAMETGTVYCYSAGKLFKLVSCVANLVASASVFQTGRLTFAITGRLAADPTEAALPVNSLPAGIPPKFVSATASIGAWTSADADPLMLLTASLNLGNVISDMPSAGATDGLVGYGITDRAVTQELSFYVPQLATKDFFALSKLDGSTGAQVTAWQVGSVQYNRVKVEARWKPRAPREGSRNARKIYTVSGPCRIGTGLSLGREFQLTFN